MTIIGRFDELRLELLGAEDAFDEMEVLVTSIEGITDGGKLADLAEDVLSQVAPDRKKLLGALVHCQSLWDLYSDIAHDGLLSIFYNRTGAEIDKLRATLRDNKDPVSARFEKAYALVAPIFVIQPEENWVMRNRGMQPYDVVSEKVSERIESIEDAISERQDEVYERALDRARTVAAK